MGRLPRTGLAAVLAAVAMLALVAVALGAEPGASPSAAPLEVLAGGDLRSDGQGPGLVGNPLLILLAVVGLGLATAVVTLVVVRLAQRD